MKLHLPTPPAAKPARTRSSRASHRDDFIIKIDEAMVLLHCHRVTLLRLIQRGRLRLFRGGKTWAFDRAEIDALRSRKLTIYPHFTVARKTPRPVL